MKLHIPLAKTPLIFPHWGEEKHVRYQLEHCFAVKDPAFLRCIEHMLGPGVLSGNKIRGLQNGDQIFSAMLGAIRRAKRTISFETYIYWAGYIGQKFYKALCERARAGVKIHIILDWVGSDKIDKKYVEKMKAAGIEIEYYHPLRWYNFNRMNNRTHRKLLIVDGRIGFIGGVGITGVIHIIRLKVLSFPRCKRHLTIIGLIPALRYFWATIIFQN
jgi:cardiolipin synthase